MMHIAGMGLVMTRGRGVQALGQALEQGWVMPVCVSTGGTIAYPVAAECLQDKTVLSKARRADRFTRMAVLAASDALADSGLGSSVDKARIGVIVATAFGPHATTFSFLDGILDFGDAAVSPTAFSHSVHNAAASYIAMTLEVRGPTLTATHFHFAFHQAVLLAETWLADGRCDAVLVGAVDELGAVMQHVTGRMLASAADGRIKPFACSSHPESVPGEGAAFFVMTRTAEGQAYGRIGQAEREPGADLQILDACGFSQDETAYRAAVLPGVEVTGYAPLFGSTPSVSAFHVATAALMLKRQTLFAPPVQDNPHGLPLCRGCRPLTAGTLVCTALDCRGQARSLVILRN